MTCEARIRPARPVTEIEVACTREGDHERHEGVIRDYAYPGSATVITWADDDRRTFRGEWPGECPAPGCPLPVGHPRGHASA